MTRSRNLGESDPRKVGSAPLREGNAGNFEIPLTNIFVPCYVAESRRKHQRRFSLYTSLEVLSNENKLKSVASTVWKMIVFYSNK